MSDLAKKLNAERKSLEEFYDNFYEEDKRVIKKEALEYADGNPDKAKDFIAGYLYSIKQPHTRTISLINLYVQDYIVPRYKKNPSDRHIVTCIRDIFRNKLYPKGLFQEEMKI